MLDGQRVLVTGANGMVGANLVRRLVASGCDVWALCRPGREAKRLAALAGRVRFVYADLTDAERVRGAVDGARPGLVFHLASTPFNLPMMAARMHFDVNLTGTLNVLEAARTVQGTRVVFTGSAAVYGAGSGLRESDPLQPGTLLGASKSAASIVVQTYARLYGLEAVELRLATVYGPWEHPRRLVPHAILSALTGADVRMSDGRQERDLVYVDDVVEALLLAAARPVQPGEVFNIGSGAGRPVREVVELLLELMGNPVRLILGALPTRPDEIMKMSVNSTAARKKLGWVPRVALDEGLKRSIAWYAENREVALALSCT